MHFCPYSRLFSWYYSVMKPRPYKSVSPSTVLLMRQIIVGLMLAAFLGMLIISIWYGTRVDAVTISKVTVRGGETISHEEVENIVRAKLDGSYLKLVPRSFAFTFPQQEVESGVREIKRIKNLTVMRTGGTELLVEFDEYVPHALWCKDSDSEGCYFLDDAGYSFSPAPSLSGGSFMRFVAIGKAPAEHTQAFSEEEYKKVHELVSLFSDAGWHISKAEIDAAGDGFLTIVDGGEFKVSLKQSSKETVDNLLTVLNSEKFAHIHPGNFEYVDLRFGSKVFVNEVTLETTASSSTSPSEGGEVAPVPEPAPEENALAKKPPEEQAAAVMISFDEPEE
jgi:hypothetical protein